MTHAQYHPDDELDDYPVDEIDEYEEAAQNCCGHFSGGVFHCGAVGSEDCEFECPFNRDIGMTLEEIERREDQEIGAALQADREAKGNAEYDAWFAPSPQR